MELSLKGIKIAILGGDRRETFLVPELVQLGAECRVVGLPLAKLAGVQIYQDIKEAVDGVQAIILPMPGTDNEGKIFAPLTSQALHLAPQDLENLPKGLPLIVGLAKPYLKQLAQQCELKLIEIAELDDVAILNSIPSAEGAIQIAMEETVITIHGSEAFVLGYGRCGITLARMLQGLGARVTVAARKAADLARAVEAGLEALDFTQLAQQIGSADIIFNTVPAPVLDAGLLTKMNKDTVIVDIASAPGGTDFTKAAELGIKAILAPGLPGKVAPKSAGLILAKVIPNLIIQELSE